MQPMVDQNINLQYNCYYKWYLKIDLGDLDPNEEIPKLELIHKDSSPMKKGMYIVDRN